MTGGVGKVYDRKIGRLWEQMCECMIFIGSITFLIFKMSLHINVSHIICHIQIQLKMYHSSCIGCPDAVKIFLIIMPTPVK